MRVLTLATATLCIHAGVAQAGATQRSIDEFVAAQGTACIEFDGDPGTVCDLFVPPVDNLIGWGDETCSIFAMIDYAGVADAMADGAFDTTFSGSVTERELADGRAEVTVRLRTNHALAWAIDGCNFSGGPIIFGERLPAVLDGATPGFADSFLHVVFTIPEPGAPLPDLLAIWFLPQDGVEVVTLEMHASGRGPLADGSPGRLVVTETGLYGTNGGPAGWDAHLGVSDNFPAEYVRVFPVGK